ncbi:MAG: hypothetical protein AAGA92_11560 [Planctomycetota bacterium]
MPARSAAPLLAALLFVSGCGQTAPTGEIVSGGSEASVTDDPIQVVSVFLEAVRSGDHQTASGQLTPLAVERIREHNLTFAPPPSETASFVVGELEQVDEQTALVESTWTEIDADGKPFDEKMTWALKVAAGSWRIVGMAADVGPGLDPVVLDFENPSNVFGPSSRPRPQPAQTVSQPEPAAADGYRQATLPGTPGQSQPVTR